LNTLEYSNSETNLEKEAYGGEFHVSKTYTKKNENNEQKIFILEGIVHKGIFRQNQRVLLGPNFEGTFSVVEI
jgi:GTPase